LKFDNKKIDECDVQDSIVASEESNHFRLVEFLLKKERANSIKLYNNLLLKKYDIPSLVSIVSSQLFSLKLLKLAMARGMRGFEIETELGMSSYQQKVNSLLIRDIPAERIDELLANFYLLDYNIKHNLINSNLGMKALLIQ
jgi:DNA polymerase III delta subunit